MYAPRSSNSLLLTIRLFTLATISSTMAPLAGADRTRTDTTTARRALVAVLPRVIEGEDGAVDMDFRILLEIGDVALERLLSLLPEQVDLDPALHVAHVGVLRLHLAHELEDQEGPGVLQNRADLTRLQLEGGVLDLGRQVVFAVGAGAPSRGRPPCPHPRRLRPLPRSRRSGSGSRRSPPRTR